MARFSTSEAPFECVIRTVRESMQVVKGRRTTKVSTRILQSRVLAIPSEETGAQCTEHARRQGWQRTASRFIPPFRRTLMRQRLQCTISLEATWQWRSLKRLAVVCACRVDEPF